MHRALEAKRESKTVDFKRTFNPDQGADWCELVKDIVAMANSGGGYIIVGVNDDGSSAGDASCEALLGLDPAQLTDKIAKYTGVQVDGFTITEAVRDGAAIAIIQVPGNQRPILFEKPGTYSVSAGKQNSAFAVGTLYVRHGAKSEPANAGDLARILDRFLQSARKEWMDGVRKVVRAPMGSSVSILPPAIRHSDEVGATPIRITEDPAAAEYRLVDPDVTHPWRQKELIAEINSELPEDDRINSFDILALRQLYAIDSDIKFFHKAKFGAPQYSPALKEWVVGEYQRDRDFFRKSREEYRALRHNRVA